MKVNHTREQQKSQTLLDLVNGLNGHPNFTAGLDCGGALGDNPNYEEKYFDST